MIDIYKKIKAIYIILLLVLFTNCSKNNASLLSEAEEVVWINADSALSILSEIEFPPGLDGKDKADYWRIRSLAHMNAYRAMTTDSLVLYSLDYYKSVNDTNHIIQSYLLAGSYYKWEEKNDSAIQMLSKGFDLAEAAKDTFNMSQILSRLVQINIKIKNYPEVVKYSKKKIAIDNFYPYYYIVALYDKKEDSIEYYINKGVALALQSGDTLSAAHYLRNYAGILYGDKKYDEAIRHINRTGELIDYYKDFSGNYLILSQIFLDKNMLDSAQFYLDKAKKRKRQGSFGGTSELLLIGDENYIALIQTYIDSKRNKRIDTSVAVFNDSIIQAVMEKNAILKEQISEKSNLQHQNLKLVINKQRTQLLLIIIISVVVISGILFYYYFQNKKKRIEEIEERAEILQRLLKEAQDTKDEKENNSYFFRKILLQQLGIIRRIATSPYKQNQELLRQVVDISNESVSTESLLKWNDLYPVIDSLYNNFYTKLKLEYGDILNEKELQLCCLLCADFSTSEISAVMQQSMQTIYQRKSSIRKKTGIEEKEDILMGLREYLYT